MPVALLLLFSIALSVGIGIVLLLVRRSMTRQHRGVPRLEPRSFPASSSTCALPWPGCWLAVKSRSPFAVQAALGLHHTKPCSWIQGLAGEEKLFIAPPLKGWVLVMGSGLPDPSDDVDVCFRFVLELSRRVGHVQLFSANRVLHYHAWVKADSGRILRGYAWAGKTTWTQGHPTPAERELNLKCFGYLDQVEPPGFGEPNLAALNVEKVPMLAARWGLDPSRIDARFLRFEQGIAGDPSWRY